MKSLGERIQNCQEIGRTTSMSYARATVDTAEPLARGALLLASDSPTFAVLLRVTDADAKGFFGCDVVGTFWSGEEGVARFGADVEDVQPATPYRVLRPTSETLSWFASFPAVGDEGVFDLGAVRYSATRLYRDAPARMRALAGDVSGHRSAVLSSHGQAAADQVVRLVSAARREGGLGQVVVDRSGDYSAGRFRDGDDEGAVSVYRMHADGSDPQVSPLGVNFFDVSRLHSVAELVNDTLLRDLSEHRYVQDIISIDWSEPKAMDMSGWAAWSRARVGLYGLLAACGFEADSFVTDDGRKSTLPFTWSAADWADFRAEHPESEGLIQAPEAGNRFVLVSPEAARIVTEFMAARGSWNAGKGSDSGTRPFASFAVGLHRSALRTTLRTLRDFHSPYAVGAPVQVRVWQDVLDGRLAVVDLSRGSGDVPRMVSESLATYLSQRAAERLVNGETTPMTVVLDEAHETLGADEEGPGGSSWLRLTTMAARYGTGVVYVTDRPSELHPHVLSDTDNWLIGHLPSSLETDVLDPILDLSSFTGAARRVDSPSLWRVRMASGHFTVPVDTEG